MRTSCPHCRRRDEHQFVGTRLRGWFRCRRCGSSWRGSLLWSVLARSPKATRYARSESGGEQSVRLDPRPVGEGTTPHAWAPLPLDEGSALDLDSWLGQVDEELASPAVGSPTSPSGEGGGLLPPPVMARADEERAEASQPITDAPSFGQRLARVLDSLASFEVGLEHLGKGLGETDTRYAGLREARLPQPSPARRPAQDDPDILRAPQERPDAV